MDSSGTSGYLKEKDAAEYLAVSARTLRRWRQAGQIKCSNPSARIYLYRRSDLDEFFASREVQPAVVRMTR